MWTRIKQFISDWGSSLTFADYAFRIGGAVGLGSALTWATSATAALAIYAPAIYVMAAAVGVLCASGIYALMAIARRQSAYALALADMKAIPRSVNPLEHRFERQRFNLNEFQNPFSVIVDGKEFIDCEILGHGAMMFGSNTTTIQPRLYGCDMVLLKKTVRIETFIVFKNCRFINCRFRRITIMVHPDVLGQFPTEAEANWVTAR